LGQVIAYEGVKRKVKGHAKEERTEKKEQREERGKQAGAASGTLSELTGILLCSLLFVLCSFVLLCSLFIVICSFVFVTNAEMYAQIKYLGGLWEKA
jgi:Flp pilus assembly protein TadB